MESNAEDTDLDNKIPSCVRWREKWNCLKSLYVAEDRGAWAEQREVGCNWWKKFKCHSKSFCFPQSTNPWIFHDLSISVVQPMGKCSSLEKKPPVFTNYFSSKNVVLQRSALSRRSHLHSVITQLKRLSHIEACVKRQL